MIFPVKQDKPLSTDKNSEPFIVPLAVPLVAGPAVLASIVIYSQQQNHFIMLTSLSFAWAASLLVLLLAPLLRRALGQKGVTALERLMGLLLTLIAVEMFMEGLRSGMYMEPPNL